MTDLQLRPPSDGAFQRPDGRRQSVPRTDRPLPTDRLKFGTQVAALKAIGIKSEFGKRAVGGEDLASALSISPATAGLNNAFFVDSGLVTREGRGKYKPTEVVNAFARKHSFDEKAAAQLLAGPLAQSWYYKTVRDRLSIGPATKEQMIEALAHDAGATKDRESQLGSLLDWLQYAGLIDAKGPQVRLSDGIAGTQPEPPEADDSLPVEEDHPQPDRASPKVATNNQRPTPQVADAVISLSFDLSLTADDLGKLDSQQIKALFESLGGVMAAKAAIESGQ